MRLIGGQAPGRGPFLSSPPEFPIRPPPAGAQAALEARERAGKSGAENRLFRPVPSLGGHNRSANFGRSKSSWRVRAPCGKLSSRSGDFRQPRQAAKTGRGSIGNAASENWIKYLVAKPRWTV